MGKIRAHLGWRAAGLRSRLAEAWRLVRMHAEVRPRAFGAFGPGSRVDAPAAIYGDRGAIHVGANVAIAPRSMFSVVTAHNGHDYSPKLVIGDGCSFGDSLMISCCGAVVIGRDVLASARVFIGDSYHAYEDLELPPIRQPMAPPQDVIIGDGAFLGVGCCILHGVTVGERAYVGANAVVTRDVEPWTVVAGNPARVIRRLRPESLLQGGVLA